MKNKLSMYALALCWLGLFLTSFWLYPKWQMKYTENTLGWDVSGYYFYLPGLFIYKDLKKLSFAPEVIEKYVFTPGFQQAHQVDNGNYVLKYSSGQAISYLPFFTAAHLYALNSDYPADGFSKPYQFMIQFGCLLISFLGLFYLRKILLLWFSDGVVSLTLLMIMFASNYLDYSAINGALTHNFLFTYYCLIIWWTNQFYKKPTIKLALLIGAVIGLSALTRPTEIIAALIPLCWGLSSLRMEAILKRINFILHHKTKLFLAISICLLVGSIQLFYWKYVSGDWIVYSYKDEGFTWLHPQVMDALFSYKTGWLVYTPLMWLALIGFGFLYVKDSSLFWPSFIITGLATYLVTAWDNWWYGGGLGLRAMVQYYPILAIALAASFEFMAKRNITKVILLLVLPVLVYFNLWLTYNAHEGKQYHAAQMTKAYFWKTAGRLEYNPMHLKLLDTDEFFEGKTKYIKLLYENDFEADTSQWICTETPISGEKSLCINRADHFVKVDFTNFSDSCQWLRVSGNFRSPQVEWIHWKMAQLFIRFDFNGQSKTRMIRVNRFLEDQSVKEIFLDVKIPNTKIDSIKWGIMNNFQGLPIIVDDIKIECFE